MRSRTNSRGVTLVELMVVLALLVFLLMAVIPSVSAWIRNTQIRNVATSIQLGLQRARAEAMRRNETVRFSLVRLSNSAVMDSSCVVSESGVSWVVSLDDPGGSCGAAISDGAAPRILDRHATGTGGKWVKSLGTNQAGGDAGDVIFDGFGRVVGTAGINVIDIQNDTADNDLRALRIVVGLGGSVRMCEPQISAGTDPRAC